MLRQKRLLAFYKHVATSAIKTESFLILFLSIVLLVSCKSYKNGFLPVTPSNPTFSETSGLNLNRLNLEKEKLNLETKQIVGNIRNDLEHTKAIHAVDINNLFGNMNSQYQLDFTYQNISNFSTDDSMRKIGREQLLKSADFYSTEIQTEKTIRRILNRGDAAHSVQRKTLEHSQKFLWNGRNRRALNNDTLRLASFEKSKIEFICKNLQDKLFSTNYKIVGFGSEVFCQIVSRIHGKPNTEELIKRIIPCLQKWDIVCQKSQNRLTDKFIPGYFGHAGIYLGDSTFVEVISNGVSRIEPKKFLEGNACLVIRPKSMCEDQKNRMEDHLKAQIGKKYDFNFNIDSPDRIICTELIYLVYDQINWETARIAGRNTLSPDDLVRTSLADNSLATPLYIDENELLINPAKGFVEELLKKK